MIGIGLLTLVPGVVGGAETYARELVRALARVGKLEYRVLVPTVAPDAADGLPSRVATSYRASFSSVGRATAMTLAAARPGPLRPELAGLEGLHFPLTVALPRPERLPAAVTALDLQHLVNPDVFPRWERAYRRVAYHRSIRRGSIVIAISEHVKETLIERLGLRPERIRVAYLGVDHSSFVPGTGPRQPVLLYPANRWPHKNHERLFRAFSLVRRERPELRLVLTGTGHAAHRAEPGVEVAGRIDRSELVRLYQSAAAVVFPSLYEGFGLPVLEAMACGCPVVASHAGALPEICGQAARLFDPTSVDEIVHALRLVLDEPAELAERGIERASGFSWEACARAHDAIYRELTS